MRAVRRRGWSEGAASLVALALCFGIAQNLIKPLIAPQSVALGGDALAAGWVVAGAGIGGLLVAIPLGMLMDRIGGRRVIGAGAVVLAGGAGIMSMASTPLMLAAGHFLFGIGSVATWLAVQALATIAVDSAASRLKVARVSTAVLMGQLAGPPLGGLLADTVDVRIAFLASFAAAIALLPAVWSLPKHAGMVRLANPLESQENHRGKSGVAALPVLSRPGLVAALAASAVATVLQTSRQAFLPLLLAQQGWSATNIGLILSVAGLGALVARASFTFLDTRTSTAALISLSLLPGALSLGVMASTESIAVILIAVIISGFSLGLAQPVTLLLVARLTSQNERGYAVGLRLAVNRSMQAAAPVAFGAAAVLLSLTAAFWLVAIACTVGGVVLIARSAAASKQ